MKGVVFVEFLKMVEAEFSPEMADDIIDACDLPSGGAYTSVGTYSHREMASLVGALSERTGTPAPALIRAFGEFLFERFHVHHAEFFDGISDSLDFLERIEREKGPFSRSMCTCSVPRMCRAPRMLQRTTTSVDAPRRTFAC